MVVVNNIRKMVSWKAIVLHDHLVVDIFVVKDDLSMNDVFELSFALGDLHPHNEAFTSRFALFNFRFRQVEAGSIVLCLSILLAANLDAHLLKALSCAETAVSISSLIGG